MLGQTNQRILICLLLNVVFFFLVLAHVDFAWVLLKLGDLPTTQVESLDVEDEHLGHVAKLRVEVRFGLLAALVAFVLVVCVELADLEVLLQAFDNGRLVTER